MTINEFNNNLEKIEKFYEKKFNNYQVEVWFKKLQWMKAERFSQIIDIAFEQYKLMPKLANILELNSQISYTLNNKEVIKTECSECEGLGVIPYYKKVKNGEIDIIYQYFGKCRCSNAEEYNYDGTKIADKEHRTKFYIESIEKIGL